MWVIPSLPEVAGPELPSLPAEVLLLRFADLEGPIPEELRIPFGEAELPRHLGAPEGPFALVPAAVHRPVPGKWHSVLTEKDWLHPLACPVLEPVGDLLDRNEIQIEIHRVHRAQIAGGVMIDDSAWVEGFHDGLCSQSKSCVVSTPDIAGVLRPVDHVRVHAFFVSSRIMAHAVCHDRRMVLRHPHEELRVLCVA